MFCKNCRFWGAYIEGACDRVGFLLLNEHKNPRRFHISAFADDDQGLEAQLITGPEFGCVLFEQEESEESLCN